MEFRKHTEYNILDSLINNNIHFALYKLPKENTINLIMQKSGTTKTFGQFHQLNKLKGFVIAPYNITENSPIIVIEPDITLKGRDNILSYISELQLENKGTNHLHNTFQSNSNSFDRYHKIYELFIDKLESKECSKLVLSRTFDLDKGDKFSAGASFAKACQKYPNSYIFLYHTPISGTWLGCSPERLISGQDNLWITDALAGTQKAESDNTTIFWDNKNKEEQQIVADYMQQQLQKAGINPQHNQAETIQAGNLLHLRSEFSFRLNNPEQIGDVLELIHPSPAINGFPKDEAFKFILDNEGYNRSYYSGFIGYLDTDYRTDLYVNLRCMEILDLTLRLYAGGGILPSSDLFSEWKETENKLQTIVSIIENI